MTLKGDRLLWAIVIVLIALWALGIGRANTAGGLIHLLLFIAVVMILVRLVRGRRIL
jgi:uncharacterized membrane protein YtjA (UPF0391 family)